MPTAKTVPVPTWAITMGIIVIVLGALGLLGSMFDLVWGPMFKAQSEMMNVATEGMETYGQRVGPGPGPGTGPGTGPGPGTGTGPPGGPSPAKMREMMDRMFHVPEWYVGFMITLGILGLAIKGGYIASGILMISGKPISLKLFYATTACMIALGVAEVVANASSGSFMLMTWIIGPIFGIFLDVGVLICVLCFDKTYFREREIAGYDPPPEPE